MNYINYLNSLSFSKVDTIFPVYKRGEGTFRGKGQYLWRQREPASPWWGKKVPQRGQLTFLPQRMCKVLKAPESLQERQFR